MNNMGTNKKLSQFVEVVNLDETTIFPVVQGTPKFNASITRENLGKELKPFVGIPEIDNKITKLEENKASKKELDLKLDKGDLRLGVHYYFTVENGELIMTYPDYDNPPTLHVDSDGNLIYTI